MRIGLAKFLDSLTIALDFVEKEILNVAPYHGQRVASITNRLATAVNLPKDEVFALTHAALLHDCALNEYFHDEQPNENERAKERDMGLHCKTGERIVSKLPFYHLIENAVLYHHETADGNGAYGKKASETPLSARLIHLADCLDVNWNLSETMTSDKFKAICDWVKKERGTTFDNECADLFFKVMNIDFLNKLSGNSVLDYLHSCIPYSEKEISNEAMIELCSIFADITDYKSHFTWRHSLGVAEKARTMAEYYKYSKEDCQKLYIAGALHDIGKLMISNNILEKPGKLSSEEYKEIQNHAMGSYRLLENISGLEEINRIASLHHEKLNGTGYPFGYTASQLSKNERLMACIDIYQALVEERPYKKGLEHNVAIGILNKMADEGQLDKQIIQEIDDCFKNISSVDTHQSCKPIENPSEEVKHSDNLELWRCPVCGYIHEGPLPNDFICPRCEQPACIFEKYKQ